MVEKVQKFLSVGGGGGGAPRSHPLLGPTAKPINKFFEGFEIRMQEHNRPSIQALHLFSTLPPITACESITPPIPVT